MLIYYIKGTHTRAHTPFFDKAADDTESVVDRALSLLDHQLVGAAHHDAYGLSRIGTTSDLHTVKK